MKVAQFDFDLPQELIAQEPPLNRGESRLMTLDRKTGAIEDRIFQDLPGLLQPGDVLVLNDSKVMPARLYGRKKDTSASVEVVLLKEISKIHWECLVKPGRKVKKGHILEFGQGQLLGQIISDTDFGGRVIEFNRSDEDLLSVLDELGEMPLPPYIKKKLEDANRYQTVYAKAIGSAAAPTAGLHFTEDLLEEIRSRGIHVCYITLHVGLGTFRPVKSEEISEHKMHEEYYEISADTVKAVRNAAREGRRVVAVGTTCVRTLETAAAQLDMVDQVQGWTDIFIYPGYQYQVVDAIITNFHLPKSTLIMMISAFAGISTIMNAYGHAVSERYRFFSFGDAMYIY